MLGDMQNYVGLSELIEPYQLEDFLKNHWPNKPLYIPHHSNKLQVLLQLDCLKSLEDLVDERRLKVRACLPDFDDEYSSLLLDSEDALKAYRNSMTLVFDSMQTQNSTIADSLTKIRNDLGLVVGGDQDLCRARSIVYATPGGTGTRLHFDANANFVIQVSGSKTWFLAPNESVNYPTERFTAGAAEISFALEKQCHALLLDELPENHLKVDLQPGDVLFVPRGYWHATETFEDSLSLNFTFSQPTWADVFTKALQEHLLVQTEWRELADGLASMDHDRKARSIEKFNMLVKKISTELSDLDGANLLRESRLCQI